MIFGYLSTLMVNGRHFRIAALERSNGVYDTVVVDHDVFGVARQKKVDCPPLAPYVAEVGMEESPREGYKQSFALFGEPAFAEWVREVYSRTLLLLAQKLRCDISKYKQLCIGEGLCRPIDTDERKQKSLLEPVDN
jgi:hypothetical protein